MNTTTTVTGRARLLRWHGLACGIASIALLASAGCNRGRKNYPTISVRSPDGGNVSVHGTYNHCPLGFFVATPEHVEVGQPIALNGFTSDAENDLVTITWSATSGTFDDPHAANTTFHCSMRGAITITLNVSDGACDSTISGDVICQSYDGGSSDDGAAGAGGATGSGGSAGGSTGAGGTTGAAGRGGTGGAAGTGAGGTTGAGGAATGGATGGSGGAGGIGGACIETEPPAAIAAACGACLDANKNPLTDGCCTITDAVGQQLCRVASACMRSGGASATKCNIDGDVTTCYCGTHQSTCDLAGQPNGPCVAEITAAAGRNIVMMKTDAPTPMQVVARQGDPIYALGRAANIQGIAAVFCPAECQIGQ